MVKNIADMLLNSRVFEFSEESVDNKIEPGKVDFAPEACSKFVPIKISKEEFKKTLKCQKAMLSFMLKQYKKAIGTEKEEQARKMYNDSLIDYDEFVKQHKDMFLDSI